MATAVVVEASDIRFVAEPELVVILTREEKNGKHIEFYILIFVPKDRGFSKQPQYSLNGKYKQVHLFKRANHVQS